jgi:hypothetical protein
MGLLTGSAWIFFIIFAAIQVAAYLAIRREWARPATVAITSVIASIIAMTLVSAGQNNSLFQVIVVGIIIGSVISSATLAIAWYFHSNELRARYASQQHHQSDEYSE